jgi:hypothetical protein
MVGALLVGATADTPLKKLANTASSKPTNHKRTQIVIANGNHTIRPVSRYFLMGTGAPVQVEVDGVDAAAGAGAAAGASDFESVFASVLGAALSGAAGATPVAGALPPLKSVTYQPEPLSWKPAAVTCFLNAGALH